MRRHDRRARKHRLTALPLVLLAAMACGGSRTAGFSGAGSSEGTSSGSAASSGGGTSSGSAASSGSFIGDGGLFGDGRVPPIAADSGCATASAKATRAPAYLLFVLDGSGSMSLEHKWEAVVPALQSIFLSAVNDPGLSIGLIVFADTKDTSISTGPGPYPEPGIDVPIGYVDTAKDAALAMRLSGMPNSHTPTFYAIQGAYGEMEGYAPVAPVQPAGQKVVVLITDGVPTDRTCDVGSAGPDYTKNPCVTLAATERMLPQPKGPILTFVIGVGGFPMVAGQDFDPVFLGNVAAAGGGAPPGCNPNENQNPANLCYLEVDPTLAMSAMSLQQSFSNALQKIRGQVLSCTFPLQTTGLGQLDPTKVNVEVNGTTVPQSSTSGWSYDNPSSPSAIVFNGPECVAVKNDPSAQVSIVIGCETVVAK